MKYLFPLLFFLFIGGCKTTGEYVSTLSEKENSPFQNIYAQVQQIELDKIPDNPPVHPEVVYKGVTADQWKIIDQIGDPLNCRQKVYDLQQLDLASFYELTPQQCANQKDCIKSALQDHDRVLLREGIYTLESTNFT